MTDVGAERYVRLGTFTKDGRRKETPVWIAALVDGRVGLIAGADTWKVKRIRATSAVELAASDGRGKVAGGVPTLAGTAAIVRLGDADYGRIESALTAKYGFQFRLFRLAARLRRLLGRSDDLCGIVIQLD